ncbi:cytochrome P450 4B1-like [Protopterus annectens]|uniref:cytochrome P450 4B1-like n=1 Tax=Protopterus annectens TaxID=7888 RepID=UPI001CF96E7C|nr:cytochrome P450 4B1-like [Protopterus annectens]
MKLSTLEYAPRLLWSALNFSALQLLTLLCLGYLLYNVVKLFLKRKQNIHAFATFPGPKSHWLLGDVAQKQEDILDYVAENSKIFHYAQPFWLGPFRCELHITHPDYVKTVFTSSEPKNVNNYRFAVGWIGLGLLILSGKKWFQHRKMLTPAFHYDVLKPYIKLVSDSVNVMLDKWEKHITVNNSLDIYQDVSLMTLDSILKCAFSCNSNCQIKRDNPYIKAVYDLTYLIQVRIRCFPYHSNLIFNLSPHGFRFWKACKLAHEHTGKVIQQRKAILKDEKELEKIQQKRYLDFLDILLCARDDDGKGLSDEDICAEVDTFMFEGHDTTASGISWILYCMAKYPEHQKKCREEIQEIIAGRSTLDWNDLGKLTYTTMVIKECLRLYPPVPGVGRTTTKTMTFPDGRSVPAGTNIGINIYSIHRQPDIWEDPEVFDPSRFLPDRAANRHSYAFVPFAAGGRNCIGQHFAMNEMKVATALTLARFELALDLARPPIKIPQVVLRSKNGIHLKLKKIIHAEKE